VIYLGRKNISRGKNKDLTDFSHLITKVEEPIKIEEEQAKSKED
jgi:hypothetical protein